MASTMQFLPTEILQEAEPVLLIDGDIRGASRPVQSCTGSLSTEKVNKSFTPLSAAT